VKRRQVVFTPEARKDLFEIYDWIAVKASPQIAISYIERIEAYCLGFEIVSERGHSRDDIRKKGRYPFSIFGRPKGR